MLSICVFVIMGNKVYTYLLTYGGNVSSIIAVSAVMGTKHGVRGGNGDDFLTPCSAVLPTTIVNSYPTQSFKIHILSYRGLQIFLKYPCILMRTLSSYI